MSDEPEVVSGEDLKQALSVIQKYSNRRGDAFDVGSYGGEAEIEEPGGQLVELLSNPSKLIESLNLTEEQANNVSSLIAGSGAGLGYKMLSKYIGGELAAAGGAFFAAYVARKIMRK